MTVPKVLKMIIVGLFGSHQNYALVFRRSLQVSILTQSVVSDLPSRSIFLFPLFFGLGESFLSSSSFFWFDLNVLYTIYRVFKTTFIQGRVLKPPFHV